MLTRVIDGLDHWLTITSVKAANDVRSIYPSCLLKNWKKHDTKSISVNITMQTLLITV